LLLDNFSRLNSLFLETGCAAAADSDVPKYSYSETSIGAALWPSLLPPSLGLRAIYTLHARTYIRSRESSAMFCRVGGNRICLCTNLSANKVI
jgi:hypothetical protein